jgi:hypothetical protein
MVELNMALPDCQIRQKEPGFGNPGKALGRKLLHI